MQESQIVKACLDLLEALRRNGLPVIATRTNAGQIHTDTGRWVKLCDPGWGDITGCIAGVPVMIECKIRHGVQRKEQQKVQRRWEKAGGVYLLVSELSMVREFLRARGLLK
jgi:hypothetical protein